MKRLLVLLVLCLIMTAGIVWAQPPTKGRGLIQRAVDCRTTVTHVIGSNDSRLSLTIINVGSTHVAVGNDQIGTHPFTLHAGAALSLDNYIGSVNCLGSSTNQIQVIEETR